MALASTILDRAENTLNFQRSSIGVAGLGSANLLTVLNEAVIEYFASFQKSGEPSSKLELETGYTLVADTAINNASGVAAGATSIIVDDSSNLGASGVVAIWDNDRPDYVAFGANDLSTTLSTVTLVSFAHEDNDVVSLLYALPSGFDDFRSEEGYENGVSVNGVPYFYTSGDPSGRTFTIYDNGTTKYLHFPRGLTGDVFVRYNGVPTVIDNESDTVDIPTKDLDFAHWRLVEYCAMQLERPDIEAKAEKKAFAALHSAHLRKNVGKRPRVRPMSRTTYYSRSQIFDA